MRVPGFIEHWEFWSSWNANGYGWICSAHVSSRHSKIQVHARTWIATDGNRQFKRSNVSPSNWSKVALPQHRQQEAYASGQRGRGAVGLQHCRSSCFSHRWSGSASPSLGELMVGHCCTWVEMVEGSLLRGLGQGLVDVGMPMCPLDLGRMQMAYECI